MELIPNNRPVNFFRHVTPISVEVIVKVDIFLIEVKKGSTINFLKFLIVFIHNSFKFSL